MAAWLIIVLLISRCAYQNSSVDDKSVPLFLTRTLLLKKPMAWCKIIENTPRTISIARMNAVLSIKNESLLMASAQYFSQAFSKIMAEEFTGNASYHPNITNNPPPLIALPGLYLLLVSLDQNLSDNDRTVWNHALLRRLDGTPLDKEMHLLIKTLLSSSFFTDSFPGTDKAMFIGQCWSVLTSVILLLLVG